MRMPGFTAEVPLRRAELARQKQWGIEVGPVQLCVCVAACYQVEMCIGKYCTTQVVCNPCASQICRHEFAPQ